MDFVNPTTVTVAVLVAGTGAFYVYQNVVEPQNQQQRALIAEQAQRELLEEHETEAKRGSNKQAKK
ncbi:hypothetical protein BGZ98_001723, partial [Dissophora globulifera]